MRRQPTQRNRPLRVAHLIQYFAIGGLERMVERLAVASQRRGVESLVIGYLGDGPIQAALKEHGIPTVLLPGGPGFDPALSLRLRATLARERIDVLHTHHLGPFVYGAPAAVLARCGHVHTEHSHELYDRPRRQVLGALMPAFAKVVAVTPEVAEFRRRFPGSCRVIPNGVPIPAPIEPTSRADARRRLGIPMRALAIGCAARLSEEKNHQGLLEGFARFRESAPDAILVCAGDGPLKESLESRAQEAGLGDSVTWLGAVEEMGSFYRALDVCVLNSHREGLPLSLLEAMSFAVPVVATDVGGVGELLAGGDGVLVPANDAVALAEALRRLSSAPEERKRLGQAGRELVRERYGVEQMAERYVTLYREVSRAEAKPRDTESVPCG
ncbi:MAG: glycosyltransferase [Myxococcota bacterium]